MRQVKLGRTDLMVSELCLGTMTWGNQTSEAEGHAQADLALDHGVNFWDTAEIYPVNPISAETAGRTEEVIGTWLAARKGRDRLVLATKVGGGGNAALRDGGPLNGAVLRQAAEASLRRLQTDHIDLYQVHWPSRSHYHFRNIWTFDPRPGDPALIEAQMLEVLTVADELVAEGKIRHFGLSNETTWGTAKWLALADRHGLPRVATVQNEYSLLCRQFDSDWAELAVMENIPLLGFSPLAAGILSGKYAGDVTPEGTRRAVNATLSGRITPQVFAATAAYLGIATRHGLDPCQMALAFCLTRPFPIVPIMGATRVAQLAVDLRAADLRLSDAVMAEIDLAHRAHPLPY